MPDSAPMSERQKKRIVDIEATRFYIRLGIALVVILVAASIIVWTGAFEWMLTVGDRGVLTAADILGFLSFMIWVITIGVLVVLFTLKRTLTRVEIEVQERDRELDEQVREHEAKMRHLISKAEERLREEHARLVALANESRQGDENILLLTKKQIAADMAKLRSEFVEYITRLHEQWAAQQAAPQAAKSATMESGRARHAESRAPGDPSVAPRLARLLGEETRLLRETRMEHDARLRSLEDDTTVSRDALNEHERRVDQLAIALGSQRTELLERLDQRVHETVTAGVKERIREAIHVAFRPGRFYKLLAGLLAGGIVIVLLLAFLGATGPGLFTVRTATFGLALASTVLSLALFALIWSFTDAMKTLRAFAGSDDDGPDTTASAPAADAGAGSTSGKER